MTIIELKKFLCLMLFVCILFDDLSGQDIKLKPFIGQSVKPQDTDLICEIPFAPDNSFKSYGYQIGDTIPDFTLYTLDDKEFNIKNELSKGKPILIVTGSYTCPVFRLRYKNLNAIYDDFYDRLSTFIVYCVEAHPVVDVSPYTNSPGEVWITPQNEAEGIYFRQPKTYLERKDMVRLTSESLNIKSEILIDGPCNEYWTHFGPGAVIAYLITPDGVVVGRNSWFNSWMNNKGYYMLRDIRALLSKTTEFYKNTVFITNISQNKVKGIPGNSLELSAEITNTSDKEMFIDIKVADQNIPMDWMVNFSADGGFPIDMDSVVMYLKPLETKVFKLAFRTGKKGQGYAKMLFSNYFNNSNKEYIEFFAEADSSYSSIDDAEQLIDNFNVYPNPAENVLRIDYKVTTSTNIKIQIINLDGKIVKQITDKISPIGRISLEVDISNIPSGCYLIELTNNGKSYFKKINIKR